MRSKTISPVKILSFIYTFATCFTAVLHAAEENPVKCEITTLSWSGNIKNLFYFSNGKVERMDVYESGFTIPVEYTGSALIAFYTEESPFSLPPRERPAPAGIARLPATGGSVLLLFTLTPDAQEKFGIKAINNSVADFPFGTYRVFNLGKEPLRLATDRTAHPVIPSQRMGIIRPSAGDPVRDMNVRIAVGGEEVYTSQWGHRENRRMTVFISPDPRGYDQLLIKKFFQSYTPPPEP